MLQVVVNKSGGRGTRTPKGLLPPHFECLDLCVKTPTTLDNARRNPSALFAHDSAFPVIRSDDLSDSNATTSGRVRVAPKDLHHPLHQANTRKHTGLQESGMSEKPKDDTTDNTRRPWRSPKRWTEQKPVPEPSAGHPLDPCWPKEAACLLVIHPTGVSR